MTTYRAGVIGHTGRGNYGHSLDTVYLGMEEIDLVAVADADPKGLAAAGERLNVDPARCYQDYRQMLAQEELDIVSVATRWLDQRHDMVIASAEAGVRGIFCEKPFARNAVRGRRYDRRLRQGRHEDRRFASEQGQPLRPSVEGDDRRWRHRQGQGGPQRRQTRSPRRRPGPDGVGDALARPALLSFWAPALGTGVHPAGWTRRRTG